MMISFRCLNSRESGCEVVKLFLCSTQLIMKFLMLISKIKYQEIQLFPGSEILECFFSCQ